MASSVFHYPSFAELPEGLIYLDELIGIVNDVHGVFPVSARNGHDAFTRSMATNYIKQGLTGPAVGKRYEREHVCRILFAATAKLVLQAIDVSRITHALFDGNDVATVHDSFADAINSLMANEPLAMDLSATLQAHVAASVCAKVHALEMLKED